MYKWKQFNTFLFNFWKKGYLYIFLISIIYLFISLNGRLGIYDWQKEVAYFDFIRESLVERKEFPYLWQDIPANVAWYPIPNYSSDFAAYPETFLFSPFIPFIVFGTVVFIKLLILFHFIIGIVGSFFLKKKLQWDDLQFRVFVILFLCSPLVIQHLAIGYTPWLNLFYFPWLIFFLADRRILVSVLGMAMVLSLILLQGGTHVFVWFFGIILLYQIFSVIFNRRIFLFLNPFFVFLFVLFLASVRIFSTSEIFAGFSQNMLPGYGVASFLIYSVLLLPIMVFPFDTFFISRIFNNVPSWDAGIYFGPMVLLIIILIWKWRQVRELTSCSFPFLRGKTVLCVGITFALLSFYNFHAIFLSLFHGWSVSTLLQSAEKYPYRFMIPGYLMMALFIAIYARPLFMFVSEGVCAKHWIKYIAKRIVVFLRKISFFIFACSSLASIFLFFWSDFILKKISEFASAIFYSNSNLRGLLFLPARKELYEHINFFTAKYWQSFFSILVLTFFAFAIYLIIRHINKISSLTGNTIYLELLLLVPLLWASCMWAIISVSRSSDIYFTMLTAEAKNIETRSDVLINVSDKTVSRLNYVRYGYITLISWIICMSVILFVLIFERRKSIENKLNC